jgi:hypothetical protein
MNIAMCRERLNMRNSSMLEYLQTARGFLLFDFSKKNRAFYDEIWTHLRKYVLFHNLVYIKSSSTVSFFAINLVYSTRILLASYVIRWIANIDIQ